MDYGISTWSFLASESGEKDLTTIIQIAKENDFGLELWLDWTVDPGIFNKKYRKHLKEVLASLKNLSLHSSLLYKSNKKVIFDEIDLCSMIDAKMIVFHPISFGFPAGTGDFLMDLEGAGPAWDLLFSAVEYASKRSVKISLENGPLNLLIEACKNVLSKIGNEAFGICLDTCHAQMHLRKYQNPLHRYLSELHAYITHIHISDCMGEFDDHLPPGKGTIDWKDFLIQLNNIGYKGTMILEIKDENPFECAKVTRNFLEKQLDGK
jgi:sugar phosphate isomerase/epimerase